MMERAAVYIRVSTEDQTEFSPAAQLYAIRQYAEKNTVSIDEKYIYTDAGISGRRADKRPAFMQMIAAAKTRPKPFDIILVHKFDRFARNREDSIVYKSLLRKECKIKVISVSEQIEDDKFSVILESMLEAMAEYYSLNLGEEVKKGMTEKARRGELQTPAPFGYRMADGLLCINHSEAEAVKLIYALYVRDNIGAKKIAQELNIMGCRTIRGNLFSKRSVEYIIRNPVYAGKIRWTQDSRTANRSEHKNPNVLIVEGRHDAIIDSALWEAANAKYELSKNNNRTACKRLKHGKYESEVTTHWLRGLVKCAECGAVLSYGRGFGNRESAYRCNKYLNGACASSQRIVVSKLEGIIIEVIEKDTAPCFSDSGYHYIKHDLKCRNPVNNLNNINDIKKRLRKNTAKLKKSRELLLEGIDTTEEYKNNKAELNEERQALKRMLESGTVICESEQRKITGLKAMLTDDGFSLTEKNSIIREIVKDIVYSKSENRIEINYKEFIPK